MAKRRRVQPRESRRPVSYQEDSSDYDSDEFESDPDAAFVPLEPPPKKTKVPQARPTRSRSKVVPQKQRPSKRAIPRQHSRKKPHPIVSKPATPSDGNIPAWSSLPYEILTSIFQYASFPLQDMHARPTQSLSWLLQAMLTCKAFAEPATNALYHTPPFASLASPHLLRDTLATDPSRLQYNYRAKVKRLRITAYSLSHSAPGRGIFAIESLIPLIPQLAEIEIADSPDNPPFRFVTKPTRFKYPDELFGALTDNSIRLKSWRWNATLLDFSLEKLQSIHFSQAFATLQHLTLSQAVLTEAALDGAKPEEYLTNILSPLSSLRSISIESCFSEDWNVLLALPLELRCLQITNCETIESKHLEAILSSHGRYLEKLVLNHNHSLNLGFLTTLAFSCPDLQILEMDLTYYSALAITHDDSSPQFDTLLRDDQIPTWPTHLQEIRLLQLRKWSSTAAENFFESLIESANNLSYLRVLVIKASLNISWRDRATFRDNHVAKIKRVFLDRRPGPSLQLASFRAYRLANESIRPPPSKQESIQDHESNDKSRRSQRIKIKESEDVARRCRSMSGDSESDTSTTEDLLYVQGRCQVLDVNIDNLRPLEVSWKEADFMDSEISGDEDWTGENEAGGTEYAW